MKKRQIAYMLGIDIPGIYWGIYATRQGAREVAKEHKLRIIRVRIIHLKPRKRK